LQWPASVRYFGGLGAKVRVVGSPVRKSLEQHSKEEARRRLGIEPGRIVLTIVGGSQGAHGLNDAILQGLDGLAPFRERIHILHLAGAGQFGQIRLRYMNEGFEATVIDFCRSMGTIYSATDLIVCRAGAMTLQELAHFALSAVLIPLPTAAGDHQTDNARTLSRENRALWVPQTKLGSGFLRSLVLSFLTDQGRFKSRGGRLRSYFPDTALETFLADVVEEG
ncbi:MAG TPA: UDP-N-acetylglucosamine--N-acetylmuramyl-(pentapeptide) pyrophosphoryl-undecaprenol N-acetylglucosamine transferase, partial [Planctomycetota bacterium]|nr:UDP-N-acetylglucosamine--N-acetylmuramyl-(pentapeptide) pyrophosphoryl-undecaprenol N-acetylglucosamine transferase [Planctomycetota bacterium]